MSDNDIQSVQVSTNRDTTSSTFADVAGNKIDAVNFTGSKKYLIIAYQNSSGDSNTVESIWVVRSDSGDLSPYEITIEERGTLSRTDRNQTSGWVFEYTQPSTPTLVKTQFKNSDDSTIVRSNEAGILAIPVGDLDAADFKFNEVNNVSSPVALTTSLVTKADTGEFTGTTDIWLVIACAAWDVNATNTDTGFVLQRTGSASETLTFSREGEATNERESHIVCWVGTLTTATNHRFFIQMNDSGPDNDHVYSSVAAINLSKLSRDVSQTRTAGATATLNNSASWASASPTQLNSLTHTPTNTGDQIVIALAGFDTNNHSASTGVRMKDDGTTIPFNRDQQSMGAMSNDADDVRPYFFFDRRNMTNVAHTIIHEAFDDSTASGSSNARDRMVVAFSLEEPAVAGRATKNTHTFPVGHKRGMEMMMP